MLGTVIIALLMAVLLCACGKEQPEYRDGRPTPGGGATLTAAATSTSTPTPSPTNTPTPTPTPIRAPEEYDIAKLYPTMYRDTIYRIPLDEYMQGYSIASVQTNNGFVLIMTMIDTEYTPPEGVELSYGRYILFHIGVPDIVCTAEFGDTEGYSPILLGDGRVVSRDMMNGNVREYDVNLQVVRSFYVEGSVIGVAEDDSLYAVSYDENGREKTLFRYSYEGEKSGEYELNGLRIHSYLYTEESGRLVFSAHRRDYTDYRLTLDPATGEFVPLDGVHLERGCYADMLEYSDEDGDWVFGGFDQEGDIYSIPKLGKQEYVESCVGGRFSTAEWTFDDDDYDNFDVVYRAYDIQTLQLLGTLSSKELKDHTFFGNTKLTDRGYVLLYVNRIGGCDLLLWDATAEQAQVVEGSKVVSPSEDVIELRNMAQKIYERFHVKVYFEEVDLQTSTFSSYRLVPCTESATIMRMMQEFYESLAEFPDGFWTEILVDGDKECLRFFICKKFDRIGTNMIASAAALTSASGDEILMAYATDCEDQFKETIVHEAMHMMEPRIEAYCNENGLDFVGYWDKELNSDKYPYFNAYTDKKGNDLIDYGGTYTRKPSTAYFIDSYSRTYAKEDRARVLENLYQGNNYYFRDSKYLRAKAENLCAMIRAAFPSIRNSEAEMPWERYIGIVDVETYLAKYRVKGDRDESVTRENDGENP